VADVDITLGFTTDQATALTPVIHAEAQALWNHPKVRALAASYGFTSVDDMTTRQQAKLCLYSWLMFKHQQFVRREAEIIHGELAAQTVEDEFPIEVD
jgi:hypothetical protein